MEHHVVVFAAGARACVTLLALATSAIVTPYDTSSHLQAGGSPLAALSNWDGVYFSHIALNGYDFEHFHAFFPLYPLLARWLARLLPLETSAALITSGWLISNVSFVLAALFLYRLGCVVLRKEVVARRAAYLFCVVPSNIFMSAFYSESLMCLLSFSGMYFLARHAQAPKTRRSFWDLVLCALLFGASSATRSNGILLSFSGAVGMEDRSWCTNAVPNLTAMYSFIQREYWNVGLFRYYELKQLPNFILAAPIIVLSMHALHGYFRVVNALLVVHIQVTTRLLCACPPLFWHPAMLMCDPTVKRKASPVLTSYGRLVVGYFLLFTVLGSVLFPSFYPWT
ncbi:hypothetical protein JG687_00006806 [Phytophthora cactorum]|uniref:GPI mannosyltransferase 2 n=1 Tax=Phytophthora cactorum TaxID=29920 RepID=A0A8T1UIM4_9STRA|nr:hypothetical protein JG687_00006806 [Phytophthora cactorum]